MWREKVDTSRFIQTLKRRNEVAEVVYCPNRIAKAKVPCRPLDGRHAVGPETLKINETCTLGSDRELPSFPGIQVVLAISA